MTNLTYLHEHYDLYRHYQTARHSGGMDQDSRDQYGTLHMLSIIDIRP